jgi:hypothetical protein
MSKEIKTDGVIRGCLGRAEFYHRLRQTEGMSAETEQHLEKCRDEELGHVRTRAGQYGHTLTDEELADLLREAG